MTRLLPLLLCACVHTPTIQETVDAAQLGTAMARDSLKGQHPTDPAKAQALEDARAIMDEVARLLGDLDRLAPTLDAIVAEHTNEAQ